HGADQPAVGGARHGHIEPRAHVARGFTGIIAFSDERRARRRALRVGHRVHRRDDRRWWRARRRDGVGAALLRDPDGLRLPPGHAGDRLPDRPWRAGAAPTPAALARGCRSGGALKIPLPTTPSASMSTGAASGFQATDGNALLAFINAADANLMLWGADFVPAIASGEAYYFSGHCFDG